MSIAKKLTTIAENEQKVYEAGKKAEYDEFWDGLQRNGNIQNASYLYYYWNESLYKPKNSIKLTLAQNMFAFFDSETDIETIHEKQGVTLDLSNCTNCNSILQQSKITRVGKMDFSNLNILSYNFAYTPNLVTIDELILKEDGSQTFTQPFLSCSVLTNIKVSGKIGQNGFNMQWSKKLSRESLISIIAALSIDTSGLTVTLSLDAVNKAFETSEGANDGSTSPEWKGITGTRSNWTISLV